MAAPFASVDAAWLRMEDPANPMVVTGVLVLDAPVSMAQVRDWLARRFLAFPRFTRRVGDPPGGVGLPVWEPDPEFSVDRHLFELALPPPGDSRALQASVGRLMGLPLDRAHPPWQFHLVPEYQGGSALVGRIHHCLGDGLALIHVMLAMADGAPDTPPREDASAGASFWDAVAQSMAGPAGEAGGLPLALLKRVGDLLADRDQVTETALKVAAGAGTLGKWLLLPPDPRTALKGALGREKRAAWSAPMPLADVKRIGRVTGSTVNDVLTAAVAGALRGYLLERGEAPPASDIRAVVPVNLRPADEAHRLGNEFGLAFLSLPVGTEDPLDRVFEARRRMTAIKGSPEAHVAFHVLGALGLLPRPLFDTVVDLLDTKATAVLTNVAGPAAPLSLMGARLRESAFWVPSAGRLGLGISLFSYAGEVSVGVQSDAGLVPDPERILEGFAREMAVLLELERDAGR